LDDRDLAEDVGLQHERVLLTFEAGQQVGLGNFDEPDPSANDPAGLLGRRDQFQPAADRARGQDPIAGCRGHAFALDAVRRQPSSRQRPSRRCPARDPLRRCRLAASRSARR
jgi:hypothetical protein